MILRARPKKVLCFFFFFCLHTIDVTDKHLYTLGVILHFLNFSMLVSQQFETNIAALYSVINHVWGYMANSLNIDTNHSQRKLP